MLLYFFSPLEPQTSPHLFVVVSDGRDIDFFAEDRSIVYSKVYILQLSDHFEAKSVHFTCHHYYYFSIEHCYAEAYKISSLKRQVFVSVMSNLTSGILRVYEYRIL